MEETTKPELAALPVGGGGGEKEEEEEEEEEAEVIALSPGALTAANRFFCLVCGRGFQRDQNLQLHRRCHNLPWELKHRGGGAGKNKKKRKRVYVCPVASCVHHERGKGLGDLSGIKKHFGRKHGEKKFKCPGCIRRYAVHSDLKAHLKTCGTKIHSCLCGTLFSKRERFERHKGYCEVAIMRDNHQEASALVSPPPKEFSSRPLNSGRWQYYSAATAATTSIIGGVHKHSPSLYSSQLKRTAPPPPPLSAQAYSNNYLAGHPSSFPYLPAATTGPAQPPALSATSLLQKAAQIGSIYSSGAGGSFVRGRLGPEKAENNETMVFSPPGGLPPPDYCMMRDPSPPHVMMFGENRRPTTLDFLGVESCSSYGNGGAPSSLFWLRPGYDE
ncbi:unnamed protein product [Cuscuta campestris]|uniref:C2H2-type domain-containing protein n=1 Tax=Cuscuta campestris TaxID=132261 RepID=A0A484N396_9ASTE|nr:unnamed protein product [Cuscuta campestris]